MSGFITIYNIEGKPVDKPLLDSLTETLKFRGPDKQQVWIDDNIGMGHALFKTTFEAEYENQPATIDNKVWITCSARIDDRENLVNKMGMKHSIDLTKTPDSELILYAYRKWNEECLTHLLGDFAFVIWDKQKQKLFCARDRFGMRQLYYAQKRNSFIICNNLYSLRQHPDISTDLNKKAIVGFLLFGDHTWMDKSQTVLGEVNSLLAAHKMTIQNGKINLNRYWDIPKNLPKIKYQKKSDYVEHFMEIFKTAVEDRIRTPSVAISMSGGMDSTSIAATVRELEKDNRIKHLEMNAITSVYDRLFSSKERQYAHLAADYLKIPINYLPADDYPFFESSAPTSRPLELYNPTYWLDFENVVASKSRVLLTGQAGDNILSYSQPNFSKKEANLFSIIHDVLKLKIRYGKVPPLGLGLRSFFKKKGLKSTPVSHYDFPSWLNPELEKEIDINLLWEEMWENQKNHIHPTHPRAYKNLMIPEWSTDDTYFNAHVTFAEKRDPFLDLRLVEFLFSIPSLPWFFQKHILRESMKGRLPKEIINRPKIPLGNMYTGAIKESKLFKHEKFKEMVPELSTFILKEKIPPLQDFKDESESRYVDLRIILLNNWLNDFLKSS